MSNSDLLKTYLRYLETHPLQGKPEALYTPANYILDLPGKRIRPMLCLLGHGLFDESIDQALKLAHAVEVFHNFTLVHDDVIDNATVRRGKATVHERFGLNAAVLTGDMMLVRAYRMLSELETDPALVREIMYFFSVMAEDVCRGQQLDVDFAEREVVQEADYIEMIRLKTSVLLGFCLQAGGRLAGASFEQSQQLCEYGIMMGIGFQIMDDYLDAFGDERTGKKIGGDIVENKQTILMIELFNRASDLDKQLINNLLNSKTTVQSEKINQFLNLFKSYAIDAYAEQMMHRYFDAADVLLKDIATPFPKSSLIELSEGLRVRSN